MSTLVFARPDPNCVACGNLLTAEEREFYAGRCGRCEQAWSDRMGAWMKGAPEPEMDAWFGAKSDAQQKEGGE